MLFKKTSTISHVTVQLLFQNKKHYLPNQISTHPVTSAGKAFLFCAFAGILEILRRKKSAL